MSSRNTEYEQLFVQVRDIFRQVDPAGLRPGQDAPIDEYDAEISKIVAFAVRHQQKIRQNKQLLVNELNTIWHEQFNESCPSAERLAEAILSAFGKPESGTGRRYWQCRADAKRKICASVAPTVTPLSFPEFSEFS